MFTVFLTKNKFMMMMIATEILQYFSLLLQLTGIDTLKVRRNHDNL